jgi:hypothetical protein
VQRKANEPLRPSVEQKPMDVGLFGDEAKQKELFQGATDPRREQRRRQEREDSRTSQRRMPPSSG